MAQQYNPADYKSVVGLVDRYNARHDAMHLFANMSYSVVEKADLAAAQSYNISDYRRNKHCKAYHVEQTSSRRKVQIMQRAHGSMRSWKRKTKELSKLRSLAFEDSTQHACQVQGRYLGTQRASNRTTFAITKPEMTWMKCSISRAIGVCPELRPEARLAIRPMTV